MTLNVATVFMPLSFYEGVECVDKEGLSHTVSCLPCSCPATWSNLVVLFASS